jgi:hypothetical protein
MINILCNAGILNQLEFYMCMRQRVRAVKEIDSKSIRLRLRRFESCRCRLSFVPKIYHYFTFGLRSLSSIMISCDSNKEQVSTASR